MVDNQGGWREWFSAKEQRCYYSHEDSGENGWEPPLLFCFREWQLDAEVRTCMSTQSEVAAAERTLYPCCPSLASSPSKAVDMAAMGGNVHWQSFSTAPQPQSQMANGWKKGGSLGLRIVVLQCFRHTQNLHVCLPREHWPSEMAHPACRCTGFLSMWRGVSSKQCRR